MHTGFRAVAMLLAVGSTLLGLAVLPLLLVYPGYFLIFGPGYGLVAGYLVRAHGAPSPWLIRMIWGTSVIVHGAWFWSFVRGARCVEWVPFFVVIWWSVAMTLSAVGLCIDKSARSGRRFR